MFPAKWIRHKSIVVQHSILLFCWQWHVTQQCTLYIATMVGHVICIPRVIPRTPLDFKRQPSGRFLITVQSFHLSHVIAATMYQRPSVHLGRPTWRPYIGVQNTDHLVSRQWPAASFSFCSYRCHSGTKGPQEYRHLHRSECWNTPTHAHITSRTPPTCDLSLGSLTVAIPEAGDFVESHEPHTLPILLI